MAGYSIPGIVVFFFWLVVVILAIILLAFIVHWAGGGVLNAWVDYDPVGHTISVYLAQTGTKEVVLLGQTVDAYKAYYRADDPPGSTVYTLADLLAWIDAVDGIERVRFTSSSSPFNLAMRCSISRRSISS